MIPLHYATYLGRARRIPPPQVRQFSPFLLVTYMRVAGLVKFHRKVTEGIDRRKRKMPLNIWKIFSFCCTTLLLAACKPGTATVANNPDGGASGRTGGPAAGVSAPEGVTAGAFDIGRFKLESPEQALSQPVVLSYVLSDSSSSSSDASIDLPLTTSLTGGAEIVVLIIEEPSDDPEADRRRAFLFNEFILTEVDGIQVARLKVHRASMLNSAFLVATQVPRDVGYEPFLAKLRFVYAHGSQAFYVSNETGSWLQQDLYAYDQTSFRIIANHAALPSGDVFTLVTTPQTALLIRRVNGQWQAPESLPTEVNYYALANDIAATVVDGQSRVYGAYQSDLLGTVRAFHVASSGPSGIITAPQLLATPDMLRVRFGPTGRLNIAGFAADKAGKLLHSYDWPPAANQFQSISFTGDISDPDCSHGARPFAMDSWPNGVSDETVHLLYICYVSAFSSSALWARISDSGQQRAGIYGSVLGHLPAVDLVLDSTGKAQMISPTSISGGLSQGSPEDGSAETWPTVAENIYFANEEDIDPSARIARDPLGYLHIVYVKPELTGPPRFYHLSNATGSWLPVQAGQTLPDFNSASVIGRLTAH